MFPTEFYREARLSAYVNSITRLVSGSLVTAVWPQYCLSFCGKS